VRRARVVLSPPLLLLLAALAGCYQDTEARPVRQWARLVREPDGAASGVAVGRSLIPRPWGPQEVTVWTDDPSPAPEPPFQETGLFVRPRATGAWRGDLWQSFSADEPVREADGLLRWTSAVERAPDAPTGDDGVKDLFLGVFLRAGHWLLASPRPAGHAFCVTEDGAPSTCLTWLEAERQSWVECGSSFGSAAPVRVPCRVGFLELVPKAVLREVAP
jgi:hypothetical protein